MHHTLNTLHKIEMGCGGSRLYHDSDTTLPPRLRPLFLLRVEEFRARLLPKDSGSMGSNTILIMPNDKNKEDEKPREAIFQKNKDLQINIHEETDFEDASKDAYHEDDDETGEEGRMIGKDRVLGGFPGSPSFRVYFKEGDGEDDQHRAFGKIKSVTFKNTVSDDDDTVPSKEGYDQNKKVKRGNKMKSFRKVLPKGGQAAVKSLLSVKSRYHPSPSAHHHHRHLLIGKTTT